MSFPEWVQVVSNIVMGVSAMVVAGIAIVGLNQWRAQLKGTTDYQVAQRILRAVLTLRDALQYYRYYVTFKNESSGRDRAERESPMETEVFDEEFAKLSRLKEVDKARSDLRQVALEAEALWGKSVNEALEPLYKYIRQLYAAHDMYFKMARVRVRGASQNDDVIAGRLRLICYQSYQSEDDAYAKELESAIKQCEAAFRVHLK